MTMKLHYQLYFIYHSNFSKLIPISLYFKYILYKYTYPHLQLLALYIHSTSR